MKLNVLSILAIVLSSVVAGAASVRANEVTITSVLKRDGYATGGFGKWGSETYEEKQGS